MLSISIILVTCLQLVSAHFSIDYPYWRGDSFTAPASQYIRSCAGVNQSLSNTNRTKWPLTGGSLVLHVSHPWAITYVNLGLGGDNTTVFNVSLVPNFNQTGNGTFCLPTINLPKDLVVSNGTQASLQVIQIGETGGSLYNCADIVFSSNATILGKDQCSNSTGVGGAALSSSTSSSSGGGNKTTSSTSSSTASSGADGSSPMGLQMLWTAIAVVGLVEVVRLL
ncbi:hypothetical protein MMC31_005067 [Peltigera leucophlebia]|nr:hypothetical protein [Peltigera leucophlebia]